MYRYVKMKLHIIWFGHFDPVSVEFEKNDSWDNFGKKLNDQHKINFWSHTWFLIEKSNVDTKQMKKIDLKKTTPSQFDEKLFFISHILRDG